MIKYFELEVVFPLKALWKETKLIISSIFWKSVSLRNQDHKNVRMLYTPRGTVTSVQKTRREYKKLPETHL